MGLVKAEGELAKYECSNKEKIQRKACRLSALQLVEIFQGRVGEEVPI